MSLLSVNGIYKEFGANTVLNGISFRLDWKQKVGIIGKNGSGKTTLLRILTQQMEYEKGSFHYAKGAEFGYLKQEGAVDSGLTVIEEAEQAQKSVLLMEKRMRELEELLPNMPEGEERSTALDEYGDLHHHYEMMGGYSAQRDARKVLLKLGFAESDYDKPNSVLSGGEKTRLALAKLLIKSPDVLFLDEPTNHLDMNAVEWLEEFLAGFGGAVVIVSHDRYFLDKVVTGILELEDKVVNYFPGRFSDYWKLKQEQNEQKRELYQRQTEEIKRLDEYVRRTMGTQKTGQAKSRLKAIERLQQSRVNLPTNHANLKLNFKSGSRSGDDVLKADGMTKSYGDRVLFNNVNLMVRRLDKIGIVGPNGSGKSTFVKLLLGREKPTQGEIKIGANVSIGYFAQDVTDLEPEMTVFDHIYRNFDVNPGEARNYLARFLFFGDSVYNKVQSLSGGEKNKLSLAMLLLSKPNLLVLDEPTNHLDMASCDSLVDTLQTYDGTLLLVSHDRYLLDKVTTQTCMISNSELKIYDGNYTAFRESLKSPEKKTSVKFKKPEAVKKPTLSPRELSKEKIRAEKKITELEEKVSEIEAKVAQLEITLSNPSAIDDLIAIGKKYEATKSDLSKAIDEWTDAVNYLEDLESL